MKNIHFPTILVTLGLVGLVAILSGQNMVAAPSVQVSNPLGVPGWVPTDVWMARFGYDPSTGTYTYQDYTVPTGHFALVTSNTGYRDEYCGIQVDEGSGFYFLTSRFSSAANYEPGIVLDEGTVVRANAQYTTANHAYVVTGYLIPK